MAPNHKLGAFYLGVLSNGCLADCKSVVFDIGGSNPSTPTIEVIWTADGNIPISGAIPEELRILLLIHVLGAMVA